MRAGPLSGEDLFDEVYSGRTMTDFNETITNNPKLPEETELFNGTKSNDSYKTQSQTGQNVRKSTFHYRKEQ